MPLIGAHIFETKSIVNLREFRTPTSAASSTSGCRSTYKAPSANEREPIWFVRSCWSAQFILGGKCSSPWDTCGNQPQFWGYSWGYDDHSSHIIMIFYNALDTTCDCPPLRQHHLQLIDWLFLIDDGLVGAWEGILSNPDFKARAEAICAASSFERVLLFRFGPRSVTVLL